jgi:hypothetical protein
VSIRTGIYLAQAGEFGFALLTIGADRGLIQPAWVSPILAAMVLSMIVTPFMIMRSEALVYRLSRSAVAERSVESPSCRNTAMKEARHVIICGFGRCGKNLAALFEKERISFVALEINDDEVARRSPIAGYPRRGSAIRADLASLARRWLEPSLGGRSAPSSYRQQPPQERLYWSGQRECWPRPWPS